MLQKKATTSSHVWLWLQSCDWMIINKCSSRLCLYEKLQCFFFPHSWKFLPDAFANMSVCVCAHLVLVRVVKLEETLNCIISILNSNRTPLTHFTLREQTSPEPFGHLITSELFAFSQEEDARPFGGSGGGGGGGFFPGRRGKKNLVHCIMRGLHNRRLK